MKQTLTVAATVVVALGLAAGALALIWHFELQWLALGIVLGAAGVYAAFLSAFRQMLG